MSEIRRTENRVKPEARNPNDEGTLQQASRSDFDFRSSFGPRISDFGFWLDFLHSEIVRSRLGVNRFRLAMSA